jgi:hypothetical protein
VFLRKQLLQELNIHSQNSTVNTIKYWVSHHTVLEWKHSHWWFSKISKRQKPSKYYCRILRFSTGTVTVAEPRTQLQKSHCGDISVDHLCLLSCEDSSSILFNHLHLFMKKIGGTMEGGLRGRRRIVPNLMLDDLSNWSNRQGEQL